MAQAKNGDTVDVHYTGKLDDGTVFDSSKGKEPLQFTLGTGQVIPGFEEPVVGMEPGQSKTIHIPSDRAYGPHQPDMVIEVPKDQLPEGMEPGVGDQLQVSQPDGRAYVVTVTNVSDASITLDANHPLAGKDLTFDIELVEIKQGM